MEQADGVGALQAAEGRHWLHTTTATMVAIIIIIIIGPKRLNKLAQSSE